LHINKHKHDIDFADRLATRNIKFSKSLSTMRKTRKPSFLKMGQIIVPNRKPVRHLTLAGGKCGEISH
jgi:hypothetical protein